MYAGLYGEELPNWMKEHSGLADAYQSLRVKQLAASDPVFSQPFFYLLMGR